MAAKGCKKLYSNGAQCGQPRAESSDSEAASKVIYCPDHLRTCWNQYCHIDISYTYHLSQYCDNHRCASPDCPKPLKNNEYGHGFCHDHQCRITGCKQVGASRKSGRDFCDYHRCQVPSCENKSKTAEKGTYELSCCSVHSCKAAGCYGMRQTDNSYCTEHVVCNKEGCHAAQSKDARFCPTHEDTCTFVNCPNPQSWEYGEVMVKRRRFFSNKTKWGKTVPRGYCEQHLCRAAECWRLSDTESGSPYCTEHEACGKTKCNNGRRRGQKRCSQHENTCARASCFNMRGGGEGTLCTHHGCKKPGCGQPRSDERDHCERHGYCYYTGCKKHCVLPNLGCSAHRCAFCHRVRRNDETFCSECKAENEQRDLWRRAQLFMHPDYEPLTPERSPASLNAIYRQLRVAEAGRDQQTSNVTTIASTGPGQPQQNPTETNYQTAETTSPVTDLPVAYEGETSYGYNTRYKADIYAGEASNSYNTSYDADIYEPQEGDPSTATSDQPDKAVHEALPVRKKDRKSRSGSSRGEKGKGRSNEDKYGKRTSRRDG